MRPPALAVTSAAANIGAKLAPDSLARPTAPALAVQTTSAPRTPLPVSLWAAAPSRCRIRPASCGWGSCSTPAPGQVNFLVPPATATGRAQITVTSAQRRRGHHHGRYQRRNAIGLHLGAAPWRRPSRCGSAQSGTQTPVTVFQCSGSAVHRSPIDLGAAGDPVFLTLFGTGLRKNSGLANVRATIGGVDAPVALRRSAGRIRRTGPGQPADPREPCADGATCRSS